MARRNMTQLKMKSSLGPVRSITAKGGKNMLQKAMTRRLKRGILILTEQLKHQSNRLVKCVSRWYTRLVRERREQLGMDSSKHEYV